MIDVILTMAAICSLFCSAWMGFSTRRLNRQTRELLVEITKKVHGNSRREYDR